MGWYTDSAGNSAEVRSLEIQLKLLREKRDLLPRQIDALRREYETLPRLISAIEAQIRALKK
jgi:prefoldin subunit 5